MRSMCGIKSRLILALFFGSIGTAYAVPPIDVSGSTFDIPANAIAPGECPFNVRVVLNGKQKSISLPGNRFIVTSPGLRATITNLSNPSKSITLNITGVTHQSTQNGNTVFVVTGRNLQGDPV